MSSGVVRKLRSGLAISAFVCLAIPSWCRAQSCATCAAPGSCGTYCQQFHCPPCYEHCQEGPPKLHFKCGCAHPVCNPCDLPHWGYFETCWTPYPFPPDWSHCPSAPPAALVNLNPQLPYQTAPPGPNQLRMPNVLPPTNPAPGTYGNGPDGLSQPRRYDGYRPGL